MKNVTIILAAGRNTRLTDICFDSPKSLLSINGQSIIERLCLQFSRFSDYIIIVAGHNKNFFIDIPRKIPNVKIIGQQGYIHENNSESLYYGLREIPTDVKTVTIVEGDIVISESAIQQYQNKKTNKKLVVLSIPLTKNDDKIIFNKNNKKFFLDKNPTNLVSEEFMVLGKYLGIITFPYNIINNIIYDLKNDFKSCYIRTIQNYLDDTYKLISLDSRQAFEIDTSTDYYKALNNPNLNRVFCPFDDKKELNLSNNIQKYIGIYDVLGGQLAQHLGFDGLWLGSYQICISRGIKDDESYNPLFALELAKELKKQLVELPIIVDIGSGFQNNQDLLYFSRECQNTNIVALCVDDNKTNRINSMFPTSKREVLLDVEFCERIHHLRTFLPHSIKIIARTELITLFGEKIDYDILNKRIATLNTEEIDAILPHYVGENINFIQHTLKKIITPKPLILIPTGLLCTHQKLFADLGIKLIIYANLDIRNRVKSLLDIYMTLATTASVSDNHEKELASPIEIQEILNSLS